MQVITHLSIFRVRFRLGSCLVSHVLDLFFVFQEGVVHPVMEPDHFPEKRHAFSGHRPPLMGVSNKYSTQESRDHISSNASQISWARHREGFQIKPWQCFDSERSQLGSVQVEWELTYNFDSSYENNIRLHVFTGGIYTSGWSKKDGNICFLCHKKTVDGIWLILRIHVLCFTEICFPCA